MKFQGNPFSGNPIVPCEQTDRQTHTDRRRNKETWRRSRTLFAILRTHLKTVRDFVSAASQIISALFCHITQRTVVISYRRYRTTLLSHRQRLRRLLDPWRWGRLVFPKRCYDVTTVSWVTCQKSADLIYRRLNMDRYKRRLETRTRGETWFWVKGNDCPVDSLWMDGWICLLY
jgi:hypothetical protein